MNWIIIETMAVLVECLAKVFFINSRFSSKTDSKYPLIFGWLCLVGWGLIATFVEFPVPVYDGMNFTIILLFLLLAKRGTLLQKLFWTMLTEALSVATSLAGASLASSIARVSVESTLIYQDNARLLAIVLIKSIQVLAFYILARKNYKIRALKKKPIMVLGFAVAVNFVCLSFMLLNVSNFDPQMNDVLIWLAIGLLIILVVIILMYEMFILEEANNIDLSSKLQRLELESQFFKELNVIHSDLRKWRHEYKNNLIALRALIEHDESEKALDYLNNISVDTKRDSVTLHTGNYVLDAVVSSKLWLASSQGIEVSIHAFYPEIHHIGDDDLCAITGNLLDNAIEACTRITEKNQTRFISFSLLVKGKNLVLSIKNSYSGLVKREGERYLTSKGEQFHGIGIKYVDSIVDKYQGHILREYENGVFETHVSLPLILPQGGEGND